MLIEVTTGSDPKVLITGGEEYRLNNGATLVTVFPSPNHPRGAIEPPDYPHADIKMLADHFPHDSICLIDETIHRFILSRDWPGNVVLFYWFDGKPDRVRRLLVADTLTDIIRQIPNAKTSKVGIKLFLRDRKHYQTHTVYDNVEVLHPGLYLDLELDTGKLSADYWYKPCRPITITDQKKAVSVYREAVDDALARLVRRDLPVALAFSGGSDSTLLLERLLKLGYNDIKLFNIQVSDNISSYAGRSASHYNKEKDIEIIRNYPEQAKHDWLELLKFCYHYLSDMRIDGMFSASIAFYKELFNYYTGKPITIVWGSQYALASPVIDTGGILKFYKTFFMNLLLKTFNKDLADRVILKGFSMASVLNPEKITAPQLKAFQKQYIDSARAATHPDELLNLHLSLNYNHLKHWWMHWRNIVANRYYPCAINVYPFHERIFQEATMPFSLFLRIGGARNIMKMPGSKKEFFLNTFEKPIRKGEIIGTNYIDLPKDYTLFSNRNFYETITSMLKKADCQPLVRYLEEECGLKIPNSYEEFILLDSEEVEQLSGAVILNSRFKADGIVFS